MKLPLSEKDIGYLNDTFALELTQFVYEDARKIFTMRFNMFMSNLKFKMCIEYLDQITMLEDYSVCIDRWPHISNTHFKCFKCKMFKCKVFNKKNDFYYIKEYDDVEEGKIILCYNCHKNIPINP